MNTKYLYLIICLILASCTPKSEVEVKFNEVVLLKNSNLRKVDKILTKPGKYYIDEKLEIIRYDLKQKEERENFVVKNLEGNKGHVYTTYRFAPIAAKVENLEDEIGNNYNQHIIKPELRNVVRNLFESVNKIDNKILKEIQNQSFESLDSILRNKYIRVIYLSIDSIKNYP